MTALILTKHAVVRMAQRGILARDAELIALIGTEVENGLLVLSRDVQGAVHALKQLITRIKRLEGKLLVTAEGRIVKTAYQATRRQQQRLLRRARERNLG